MPHLNNPSGEDNAFDQKDGGIRQDAWEDLILPALERGDNHFSVDVNVYYEDESGFHEESVTVKFDADSIEEWWDNYYEALRDMIDELGNYEDGGITTS